MTREIEDGQIVNPLNDEDAKEFYRNALIVALENNDDVFEFCLYGKTGLYECDVLVRNSTENISNVMYNLDMSSVQSVRDVSSPDIDFEFDHLTEWQDEYESGLIVTVSLIPHRIFDLQHEEFRWCPVHPHEIVNDNNHDTIYEGLSHLFGGVEEDYMLEDNNWVEKANEKLDVPNNLVKRHYTK